MKVTFLITNICHCAGTERVVSSITNYIVTKQVDVEIVSLTSTGNDFPFFPIENRIKIHHLGITPYEYGLPMKKIMGYFRSYFVVKNFLKEYDTDILVGTSRNTNILALINRKSDKIRVIGCEHFSYNTISAWALPIRKFYYRKLEKLVVLTERDEVAYSRQRINTLCIPNAVSFDPVYNKFEKRPIALAVGRNSIDKNFDRLLRLWAKLDEKDWILKIVGEGPLLEQNKATASELGISNVEFIPFTKKIQEYYNEASIYLMTSRYESYPMVLIEAKTCGCACVSFDCETGPREIIRDGVDGYVIPYDDDNLFVDKVKKLIKDNTLLSEMQKASYDDSYRFSRDSILRKWLELFGIMQDERGKLNERVKI